jgi:hypothetical protein
MNTIEACHEMLVDEIKVDNSLSENNHYNRILLYHVLVWESLFQHKHQETTGEKQRKYLKYITHRKQLL